MSYIRSTSNIEWLYIYLTSVDNKEAIAVHPGKNHLFDKRLSSQDDTIYFPAYDLAKCCSFIINNGEAVAESGNVKIEDDVLINIIDVDRTTHSNLANGKVVISIKELKRWWEDDKKQGWFKYREKYRTFRKFKNSWIDAPNPAQFISDKEYKQRQIDSLNSYFMVKISYKEKYFYCSYTTFYYWAHRLAEEFKKGMFKKSKQWTEK